MITIYHNRQRFDEDEFTKTPIISESILQGFKMNPDDPIVTHMEI